MENIETMLNNIGGGFIITYIISILLFIFVWITIIKIVFRIIKQTINIAFFKKSVIKNTDDFFKPNKEVTFKDFKDVDKDKLAIFDTDDINKLKDYFYEMFLNFENAYNTLDFNKMHDLLTNQLYQNYYTGLSLNMKYGEKKIVENVKKKNMLIYDIDSTSYKQVVCTIIEISYISYTTNKNGQIIKGSKEHPITEKFEVIFRKDFQKNPIKKCPNCGATVINNICEYCRTTLKNEKFKIHSIRKIID